MKRWTARRYGPHLARKLQPATDALIQTIYSVDNPDLYGIPLYRNWAMGSYLPGLTPGREGSGLFSTKES